MQKTFTQQWTASCMIKIVSQIGQPWRLSIHTRIHLRLSNTSCTMAKLAVAILNPRLQLLSNMAGSWHLPLPLKSSWNLCNTGLRATSPLQGPTWGHWRSYPFCLGGQGVLHNRKKRHELKTDQHTGDPHHLLLIAPNPHANIAKENPITIALCPCKRLFEYYFKIFIWTTNRPSKLMLRANLVR